MVKLAHESKAQESKSMDLVNMRIKRTIMTFTCLKLKMETS